jgi:hypothetical protein
VIFLIDYDRSRGELSSIEMFDDSERAAAEDQRLKMELTLHRKGVKREIVLLQAASEDALKETHGRYFAGIAALAEAAS